MENYCECGCGTVVRKRFAKGHYARVNNPMKIKEVVEKHSGKNNSNWVPIGSTRIKDSRRGLPYVFIKVAENEWEYEHRVNMESYLGRKLQTNEHVHHLNGNTLDNRVENLSVVDITEHSKLHCSFDNVPLREFSNGEVITISLPGEITSRRGENNGMYGKKHSEETRNKMRDKALNRKVVK